MVGSKIVEQEADAEDDQVFEMQPFVPSAEDGIGVEDEGQTHKYDGFQKHELLPLPKRSEELVSRIRVFLGP